MRILFFLNISLFLFIQVGSSQNIPVYEDFEEIDELLHKNTDTTYVINFWATWCAPCVKEMPAFNRLYEEFKNEPVDITLISLDFGSSAVDRVRKFSEKHGINAKIVILDDPDSNSWIDKVSPEWSGALPGTLIYNRNFREFYEKEFTYKELYQIVKSKIK
jgi:thiol-disulfide isomerase/thioredoxin